MKTFQACSLLNDFTDKCRFCLKTGIEMIDIFDSGSYNQIIEVANVKISCSDKLPKMICRDCRIQLEQVMKFLGQVKNSDDYLKTLLLLEQNVSSVNRKLRQKKIRKKKRSRKKCVEESIKCNVTCKNYLTNLKDSLKNDKIYLIVVGEANVNSKSQNEICIKDLDLEDESELSVFCRSIIKDKLYDHTYSYDKSNTFPFKAMGSKFFNGKEYLLSQNLYFTRSKTDKVYGVNLYIYQCNECQESFECNEDLTAHMRLSHNVQAPISEFKFICPVCSVNEDNKNMFMKHLIGHKKDGFLFLKLNGSGEDVPLNPFEEEVFEVSKVIGKSKTKYRVFRIATDCYKCLLCKKLIDSTDCFIDHLKECSPDYAEKFVAPHIKYTCPACFDTWIDDADNFNIHLMSHKGDNIFFIKVNNDGESVNLGVNDFMFTPFERVLEMLSFETGYNEESNNLKNKMKIVKMQDICCCSACSYEANSFNLLLKHYWEVHQDIRTSHDICCPVCFDQFSITDSDKNLVFFNHLGNHMKDGILFLKGNRSDSAMTGFSGSSEFFYGLDDIFSGKINFPELECNKDVFVPQIFTEKVADLEKTFYCDFCRASFCTKRDIIEHLKLHVKETSGTSRDYICEKCGRKCFGRGNYKRHFITHLEKSEMRLRVLNRPKCSNCSKTFPNFGSSSEHKKHHMNDGIEIEDSKANSSGKICEVCGRKFSNNSSLAKHMRLHTSFRESLTLKCKICQRDFRRESALGKHMSAHLNPNYFECEQCKLPLPSLNSLQRHKLGHQGRCNTFDCKVCKVSFLSKDRLISHQTRTGHNPDRKRFECNVCHKTFFVGREFSQHIKLHPKYKMSECTLCGKRLSTMQSLMLHLGRHFESNSILCPHCGKQFFEERNYHRHLLTHNGFKPFSCDIEGCNKCFYTYFELNRHKKYHSNTRDFNCPHCPKSFHEANHLKVHIRTHTGERPYTCPHCRKGFVTRTRCKQHINLIHQGVGCDLIQSNISKKVAVFQAVETTTSI